MKLFTVVKSKINPSNCSAIFIFYAVVINGWKVCLVPALLLSLFTYSLLGYHCLHALLPVLYMAGVWQLHGDCKRFWLQLLPVSVCMLAVHFILTATVQYNFVIDIDSLPRLTRIWLSGALLSTAVFPFMLFILDFFAENIHCPSYRQVQADHVSASSS